MSKRVQVTLTEDEYAALLELSELRGESMSSILGGEIAAGRLAFQWRAEAKKLRKLRAQEERVAAELAKVLKRS